MALLALSYFLLHLSCTMYVESSFVVGHYNSLDCVLMYIHVYTCTFIMYLYILSQYIHVHVHVHVYVYRYTCKIHVHQTDVHILHVLPSDVYTCTYIYVYTYL